MLKIYFLLFLLYSHLLFSKELNINDYKFKYSFDIGGEPSLSAIEDKDGFLWFGSLFSGLVRFDGTSVKKIYASADSITDNFVTQIFEDSDGIIWIGSAYGLTAYDKNTNSFTQYFADKQSRSSSIIDNGFAFSSATILEDNDGNIWFGTLGGISKLDKKIKKFQHYQNIKNDNHSLSSNLIYSIFMDSDGIIWVGTKDDGLNRYNKDQDNFSRFTFESKDPTLEGQVLVTPIRGYNAFHLKGVRVTALPTLI